MYVFYLYIYLYVNSFILLINHFNATIKQSIYKTNNDFQY